MFFHENKLSEGSSSLHHDNNKNSAVTISHKNHMIIREINKPIKNDVRWDYAKFCFVCLGEIVQNFTSRHFGSFVWVKLFKISTHVIFAKFNYFTNYHMVFKKTDDNCAVLMIIMV